MYLCIVCFYALLFMFIFYRFVNVFDILQLLRLYMQGHICDTYSTKLPGVMMAHIVDYVLREGRRLGIEMQEGYNVANAIFCCSPFHCVTVKLFGCTHIHTPSMVFTQCPTDGIDK